MFRSRFGGLWIDRRDAHDIVAERVVRAHAPEAPAPPRSKPWEELVPLPIRASVRRHVDQLSSNHH